METVSKPTTQWKAPTEVFAAAGGNTAPGRGGEDGLRDAARHTSQPGEAGHIAGRTHAGSDPGLTRRVLFHVAHGSSAAGEAG